MIPTLPCRSSAGRNWHPFPRHRRSCADLCELRVHLWRIQHFYHTSHGIWFTLNHDWNIAVCLKQARNDKVLAIYRVAATFRSQLSNSQVQSQYKDFNILVLCHPVVTINLLWLGMQPQHKSIWKTLTEATALMQRAAIHGCAHHLLTPPARNGKGLSWTCEMLHGPTGWVRLWSGTKWALERSA